MRCQHQKFIKSASPFLRRLLALRKIKGLSAIPRPALEFVNTHGSPIVLKSSKPGGIREFHRQKLRRMKFGENPFFRYESEQLRAANRDGTPAGINDVLDRYAEQLKNRKLLERFARKHSNLDKEVALLDHAYRRATKDSVDLASLLGRSWSKTTVYKGGNIISSGDISKPYWFSGDPAIALHFAERPTAMAYKDMLSSRLQSDLPVLTIANLRHSKTFKKGKTFFTPQVGGANKQDRLSMLANDEVWTPELLDGKIPGWYYKPNFEIVIPGHEAVKMPKHSYILSSPELPSRPWHSKRQLLDSVAGIDAIPYTPETDRRLAALSELRVRLDRVKELRRAKAGRMSLVLDVVDGKLKRVPFRHPGVDPIEIASRRNLSPEELLANSLDIGPYSLDALPDNSVRGMWKP